MAKKKITPVVSLVDPQMAEQLKELLALSDTINDMTLRTDELTTNIRIVGVDKLSEHIKTEKPEMVTINVKSPDGKDEFEYDIVPADSYPKYSDEEYDALKAKYGEIVTNEEIVTIDAALFEKYSTVLQDFIKYCEVIPEEEKEKFFSTKTKRGIAKGTLSKINDLAASTKKTVKEVIDDIKPAIKVQNVHRVTKEE
jgi:hypothetical protein